MSFWSFDHQVFIILPMRNHFPIVQNCFWTNICWIKTTRHLFLTNILLGRRLIHVICWLILSQHRQNSETSGILQKGMFPFMVKIRKTSNISRKKSKQMRWGNSNRLILASDVILYSKNHSKLEAQPNAFACLLYPHSCSFCASREWKCLKSACIQKHIQF